MIRYFVIHNKEMNRYEPMCFLREGDNVNRAKELFEDYVSKKPEAYDEYREVTEEQWDLVSVSKEIFFED